MKVIIAALLLLPGLVPGHAGAQTLPGSRELDDSKLKAGEWEVTMTFRRGEQSVVGGSTKYRLVELPGGRWGYITSTTSQLGTATDTSIARKGTLEPISHRSHAVPRKLSLDYAGTKVTGRLAPVQGAATEISRTTEVPAFDAAMLDLILGSLPLATGYATRLPMYIEEQEGLTWFDVSVAGDALVGSTAGWDVKVVHPKYSMNFVIAKDDRRFLAGRIAYPNGAAMEITRK
jgi:hypothetical protein